MKSLLDELFDGEYDLSTKPISAEYRRLIQQTDVYVEMIHDTLGLRFLDDYTFAQADVTDLMQKEAFREGVRFGIRFCRELPEFIR